ncbi:hypothetical protein DPT59_21405 [Salmonella enterica subsp. enterica serovar Stanleyville]|nr:hypothetical protein SES26_005530 [Salmonella enterica subsp. enterica serovar Saintpaul str. SARA26]EBQ9566645.1 hypothetical protein [Salmonella enterica subsp. enterica serovar Stanleyville]EEY6248846.1 hypothetical protein [Escherichia coli]HBX3133284.1 hypothetical protein [Klebsiella pneumoniae]EBS3859851.1 hypothetical protein [Salmonella enterica subsp. enterica serovar Stanleyville]
MPIVIKTIFFVVKDNIDHTFVKVLKSKCAKVFILPDNAILISAPSKAPAINCKNIIKKELVGFEIILIIKNVVIYIGFKIDGRDLINWYL